MSIMIFCNILAALIFAMGLALLLIGETGVAGIFPLIAIMLGMAGAIAELRLQIKQIRTDLTARIHRIEYIVVIISDMLNIKEEKEEGEKRVESRSGAVG